MDVDHPLPPLLGHVDGRLGVADPGVVDEHVEPPEVAIDAGEELVHRGGVDDVDRHGDGAAAEGLGSLGRGIAVEVGHDDGIASGGESLRVREAEPLRGPGDHCHPLLARHGLNLAQ